MKTCAVPLAICLAVAPLAAQTPSTSTAGICCTAQANLPASEADQLALFCQQNLMAWCIVPFDAKKRGPEERAEMLDRLGIRKLAYDWRDEHIPTFDTEVETMKRHGIEMTAWWFPTSLDATARTILQVIERHKITPQLWVMGSGTPTSDPNVQAAQVEREAARIRPIADEAKRLGCKVALYNHGGWFGEPENQIAIIEKLQKDGVSNVGIVYNLHHGHDHLSRFPELWKKMQPHLLAVNLNGMVRNGEQEGRKILNLSEGDQELAMMRLMRDSGWRGPVGIIDHRPETDSEVTLRDNLKGLEWLRRELVQPGSGGAKPFPGAPKQAQLDTGKFGKALDARGRGVVFPGVPDSRKTPLTVECWARLQSSKSFNVLVASDTKASAAHWELYTYAGSGDFSVFLPGRGGEFRSGVAICDDAWHHLSMVLEESRIRLYVDGKLAKEKSIQGPAGSPQPGGLAAGRLVEGGIGCDGWVDEVRIANTVQPPTTLPTNAPQRDPNTIALWHFDEESDLGTPAFAVDKAPLDPAAHPLHVHPVNRDRVYDFYAKQARYALGQQSPPQMLPPYPGLDGGSFGHWGNQNESTWTDGRWNEMDTGSAQSCIFHGWGQTIPRGVAVRLGSKGEMAACFDPDTLTWVGAWTGGFVRFASVRHGFLSGCEPVGQRVEIPNEPPAPRGTFTYHGFYRNGPRVVFHYTRDGVEWLDSAWCEDGRFIRTRVKANQTPLADLTKAGGAQWPDVFETKGSVGSGAPYAIDTLTLPAATPWRSLWHFGDHDFFPNGDAALCTIEGEVWLVRGIDASLGRLRWKRFAAGLNQPLGLKIADGKIYVLGRDQLTVLEDSNGDDEADYYKCLSNAFQTSPAGHDFITGLQRDADGRFYFASSNQGVCRISGDGRSVEVLATGFRNPDGLGLGPRGEVIAAVQEGEWTPASMLAEITPGGHYGYRGPKPGPLGHVPPIAYLPRGIDNSCGGQVFSEGTKWGLPPGMLVHLSFGTGSALVVFRDATNPAQAGVLPLPGDFSSGAHRGRFHPTDGQLYVTGTAGWGTYTPEDGCFQRLRYSGGAVRAPISSEARENGVMLTFAEPLDSTSPAQPAAWFAQAWNYRYGPAYGSDEISVQHGHPGHDVLRVNSAHILRDGRSIFLEIPQLQPANTLHLYSASLPFVSRDLFLTIHKLGPAFTDFPGYHPTAKQPVLTAGASAAPIGQPLAVKWENGAPGRSVRIQTTTGLQFAQRELHVKAGERISLTLDNPDVMPHNWVLGAQRAVDHVTDLANKLVTDANAVARHYVPDSPDVLVHTRIVEPANSTTIHFNAPAERGDYPYLCTFPGHPSVMRGVMRVE